MSLSASPSLTHTRAILAEPHPRVRRSLRSRAGRRARAKSSCTYTVCGGTQHAAPAEGSFIPRPAPDAAPAPERALARCVRMGWTWEAVSRSGQRCQAVLRSQDCDTAGTNPNRSRSATSPRAAHPKVERFALAPCDSYGHDAEKQHSLFQTVPPPRVAASLLRSSTARRHSLKRGRNLRTPLAKERAEPPQPSPSGSGSSADHVRPRSFASLHSGRFALFRVRPFRWL
jgi:hypothetical protein